jgi:hypothetical protein
LFGHNTAFSANWLEDGAGNGLDYRPAWYIGAYSSPLGLPPYHFDLTTRLRFLCQNGVSVRLDVPALSIEHIVSRLSDGRGRTRPSDSNNLGAVTTRSSYEKGTKTFHTEGKFSAVLGLPNGATKSSEF